MDESSSFMDLHNDDDEEQDYANAPYGRPPLLHNSSINDVTNKHKDPIMKETEDEIRTMNVFRVIVIATLMTIAAIAANVVFVMLTMQEERRFEEVFAKQSHHLIDHFYKTFTKDIFIAETLAIELSIHASSSSSSSSAEEQTSFSGAMNSRTGMSVVDKEDRDDDWPYITYSNFEMRTFGPMTLSNAASISFAPLLFTSNNTILSSWERYAATNIPQQQQQQQHASVVVSNSNGIQQPTAASGVYRIQDKHVLAYSHNNTSFPNNVWGDIVAPVWQTATANRTSETTVLFFDLMSNPIRAEAIQEVIHNHSNETVTNNGNIDENQNNSRIHTNGSRIRDSRSSGGVLSDFLFEDTHGTDYRYYASPTSSLYVPIYSSFHSNTNNNRVVGILGLELTWNTFFEGILDDDNEDYSNHESVMIVVESPCRGGRTFTFHVIGPNAYFVNTTTTRTATTTATTISSKEDIINNLASTASSSSSQYSAYLLHSLNTSIQQQQQQQNKNRAMLDESIRMVCDFQFYIYPTEDYTSHYLTQSPNLYRWITLFLFGFTFAIFLIYDCVVERKQNNLLRSAERSTAIISSLFPSTVQDRLFSQNNNNHKTGVDERKRRISNGFSETNQSSVGDLLSESNTNNHNTHKISSFLTPKRQLARYLRSNHNMTNTDFPHNNNNIGDTNKYQTSHNNNNNNNNNCSVSSDLSLNRTVDVGGSLVVDEPIADLYSDVTVFFADICGFTAWSSERDPTQVFTLLETIYRSMDLVARRLGVFKVETIGDSYVAATGLPEPRDDHAVAMARFARVCLVRNNEHFLSLQTKLGPGTADLAMRYGIHSGPVTAGVLRGEKSRFQLFGDTMNTASRMESTGSRNKIQISESTAELLSMSGKSKWFAPRKELVAVKGKGDMHTYWLRDSLSHSKGSSCSTTTASLGIEGRESVPKHECGSHRTYSIHSTSNDASLHGKSSNTPESSLDEDLSDSENMSEVSDDAEDKNHRPLSIAPGLLDNNNCDLVNDNHSGRKVDQYMERLIDWSACSLFNVLQKVVAKRAATANKRKASTEINSVNKNTRSTSELDDEDDNFIFTTLFADKAEREIEIEFPPYNEELDDGVELSIEQILPPSLEIKADLRSYVASIASMYNERNNRFHNFEHASHVTLSATKLIRRVVLSSDHISGGGKNVTLEDVHKHTFGISSDPLTHFALVFSALIHDVGHSGVSHKLCNNNKDDRSTENSTSKVDCGNKSSFQRESIRAALELLFSKNYSNLRKCLYVTKSERNRFLQIVINSVIATDIFDEELKTSRNIRWENAFRREENDKVNEEEQEQVAVSLMNRRALLITEYIIQASDFAHTMQHWHIYQKWSERRFDEMYLAYISGRSDQDPSVSWYDSELHFFNDYVIPLARKLKECGVFGVSGDESLSYALQNRDEWILKGRGLSFEMREKFESNKGVAQKVTKELDK